MIGNGGGELTSLDRRTDFLVPAGALISDTTFTYIPQPSTQHGEGLLAFAHNSFELSAEDSLGNPITAFNLPLTVTLSYTDTDFTGFPEDTLGLYFWDDAACSWNDVVTTCTGGEYMRDMDGNLLALPLCHPTLSVTEFGVFAIPLRNFLPVVRL